MVATGKKWYIQMPGEVSKYKQAFLSLMEVKTVALGLHSSTLPSYTADANNSGLLERPSSLWKVSHYL
jgi:hypothetical protein